MLNLEKKKSERNFFQLLPLTFQFLSPESLNIVSASTFFLILPYPFPTFFENTSNLKTKICNDTNFKTKRPNIIILFKYSLHISR